eukprot:TRINITY_DN9245_c0_g1_i1.p1 TRINITY_DN9245_c0_g1~~TRINITY_DN9245_c0_g1_i1.p1  ORF type:complete len:908 (-),score=182.35 TRINITY_DN9245_c0_g1_i1:244-2967(-)
MKVALIGQSVFGAEVFKQLQSQGHEIVGVFTIPDVAGKADPLAEIAEAAGARVFKFPRWKALPKDGGKVLPSVMETYASVNAELNVLAYVTQFIPMEVIDHPKHGSIVYHPSILPRHRGASAINWTLMEGDAEAGFSIFWADDGLDTGPILLIKKCKVEDDDTVNSLYTRFLFPEGVKAMGEAVDLIQQGKAPRITQPEEGATYDKMWKNKDLAKIPFDKPAWTIHNFIRGNDKVPGAWGVINGQQTTLFSSTFLGEKGGDLAGTKIEVEGTAAPEGNFVCDQGIILTGNDGKRLLVKLAQIGKKTLQASELLRAGQAGEELVLTESEQKVEAGLNQAWRTILSVDKVEEETDFFECGAASMDVTRLIDSVVKISGVILEAEEVYMNTSFSDFLRLVIKKQRTGGANKEVEFKACILNVNGLEIKVPTQMLINGKFVDAQSGKTDGTVNPTTEEEICQLAEGDATDVNLAVAAAKEAFEGPWRKMNARDRGKLMYKLADLMEANKEQLAIIESIDSGAVYTLALKTHVGMSIDTFRYFAGWCDKIQGRTIPINNARPAYNLCFTKKEPLGVCGIIIPWNYPLMMLAWKMAACLAAGNTVVLKPAKVTPLTALKFAELTVLAGFPPGVINILTGPGGRIGQAIADHADVRKLGFTGSTPIGKTIMESAAKSNLKKVSLELGGKSPLIIFEDCDMEKAVKATMSACFFNKGENCIAAGRVFVQESIHDELLRRIVADTKKMTVGDPLDPKTDHGPQNHYAHLKKLLEYVDMGVKEGATLVYGGKRVDCKGYFLLPTIFTDVKDDSFIAKEESFGPVMIISKFDGDVDRVLKRANATEYGLASGVFTRDLSKALRVADALEAGTCFVNTYNKTDVAAPFGGFKQSGFGKDLGEEALTEYLRTKTVTVEYA